MRINVSGGKNRENLDIIPNRNYVSESLNGQVLLRFSAASQQDRQLQPTVTHRFRGSDKLEIDVLYVLSTLSIAGHA